MMMVSVVMMMMSVRTFFVMNVTIFFVAVLILGFKLKRYVSDTVFIKLIADFVLYLM